MARNKSREGKSLLEESMLVVANILRLSSLSLARKSLAVTTSVDPSPSPYKQIISTSMIKPNEGASSTGKRAQEPELGPKLSYVFLPAADREQTSSSYVVHEVGNGNGDARFSDYIRRFHEKAESDLQNAIVEGKAADYIRRFHEKNRNDSDKESRLSGYIFLPPPPRQLN
ncbi:hypothetical protein Nepgr_027975 [Nepenthes gracilis]|uniref:Uncharacterized protein n=1 Tax=Nepenthes gracilis TaxID=150966 RepID=A0AAD3TCQ9_NEPGR|nr:hypothetical protein Nepgr_027975 [Nepenthes gracilis]